MVDSWDYFQMETRHFIHNPRPWKLVQRQLIKFEFSLQLLPTNSILDFLDFLDFLEFLGMVQYVQLLKRFIF